MPDLLPCPFCGDQAILEKVYNGRMIRCGKHTRGGGYDIPRCPTMPSTRIHYGPHAEEIAASEWNIRRMKHPRQTGRGPR